jgi:hypothetical protein
VIRFAPTGISSFLLVHDEKKAKRTRKTKLPTSPAPTVNIQDIIDQVLAKNRVARTTGPPDPDVPRSSGHTTEKSVPDTLGSNPTTNDTIHTSVADTSAAKKPTQETKKSRATQKSKPTRELPCPVCNQSPFHLQYQCPLVTGSPQPLQRRITELKTKQPVPRVLIKELEGFLSRLTSKNTKAGDYSMEPIPAVQSSDLVPETHAKSSSSVEGLMNGIPIKTGIVHNKDDSSSDDDDDYGKMVPNVVPVRDPDDDLDALLTGPKLPAWQKKAVLEASSESAEDDDEREDVELEDDEVGTSKSRDIGRHRQDQSSDEEVVGDDPESSATEPLAEDQLAVQASHSSASGESYV